MKNRILVVGSFVEDLIVKTKKAPKSGESVIGDAFSRADGGKGANQAVQIARLGGDVKMVGKVGSDVFAESLITTCRDSGIDVSEVIHSKGNSGISIVILEGNDEEGYQNRIIMTPGANYELTVDDVRFLEQEIQNFDYLVLQYEIPQEVNVFLAKTAYFKGVKVICNPAPYRNASDEFLSYVTYFIPNETEFKGATGYEIDTQKEIDINGIATASKPLLEKGIKNVIVTLGSRGSCLVNEDGCKFFPSVKNVKAVDPTAAGDSFIGALATYLGKGLAIDDAILFANAVGSFTVQRLGAMPSLCTDKEFNDYLKEIKDENYRGLPRLLKE